MTVLNTTSATRNSAFRGTEKHTFETIEKGIQIC